MSHCIMYKDIADCEKPTCEGCELKNSSKTDCNGECNSCKVYACPGHPHFDPMVETEPTCNLYPEHCEHCNESGEGTQAGCYKHIPIEAASDFDCRNLNIMDCGACNDCPPKAPIAIMRETPCPINAKVPCFECKSQACTSEDVDQCDVCKDQGRRCIIEADFTAEPGYCYIGRC